MVASLHTMFIHIHNQHLDIYEHLQEVARLQKLERNRQEIANARTHACIFTWVRVAASLRRIVRRSRYLPCCLCLRYVYVYCCLYIFKIYVVPSQGVRVCLHIYVYIHIYLTVTGSLNKNLNLNMYVYMYI